MFKFCASFADILKFMYLLFLDNAHYKIEIQITASG